MSATNETFNKDDGTGKISDKPFLYCNFSKLYPNHHVPFLLFLYLMSM